MSPSAAELSFVMPVTTFTAVVLSAMRPALVAPAGAVRIAERVKPAGMSLGMSAVIQAVLWVGVTDHELAAAGALVGALPAVAVLMTSEGAPVTEIWLMALTWNVTVCVTWAEAVLTAAKATMAPIVRKFVDFDMVWFLRDVFVCGFRPRESRGTFGWVTLAQSRTA